MTKSTLKGHPEAAAVVAAHWIDDVRVWDHDRVIGLTGSGWLWSLGGRLCIAKAPRQRSMHGTTGNSCSSQDNECSHCEGTAVRHCFARGMLAPGASP